MSMSPARNAPFDAQAETPDHAPVYHNVPPSSRLRGLLALESEDLWIAVIYSLVIGLLTLAVPVATQSLVNTVAFGNLLQPLIVLALLVLLGLSLSTVLQSLRIYVVELVQRRVFVRISSTVTKRIVSARRSASSAAACASMSITLRVSAIADFEASNTLRTMTSVLSGSMTPPYST